MLFCKVKTASASQPFQVTPVAAATASVLGCLDEAGSIDSRASSCSACCSALVVGTDIQPVGMRKLTARSKPCTGNCTPHDKSSQQGHHHVERPRKGRCTKVI